MNDKRRPDRPGDGSLQALVERLNAIYLLLDGTHRDVHGIRRQMLDAIEKSQTAVMNRISLLEAKVDKLGTGVTPAELKDVTADLAESREKLAASVAVPKP